MKKFMKKGLAAILAMTVMFTAAPIQTVWAQDVSAEQTQVENNATDDASDNVETQATQSQIDSTLLQYVVVDQATINSPDTQNIVIGFEDNVSYVKQAVLKITNMDSGEEYEITASEITESAMKFSIDYMDSTVSGKFKVTSVTISDDNSSKTILLSDAGIDAVYSVNSEIETNPDAYVVDSDDDPDLTVENVDQDGNVESADSLEDALNVAQEENADQASSDDYGIDLYSASSSNVVVVLDPGHGGSDPGTTYTVNGTYLCERDINLKIAQYCKAELEKYLGVTVYMTRSDNTSPNTDREQRARFAKEHGAHVLVSIHINSSSNREAHGAEVYYPNASYNANISNWGKDIGNSILNQISNLGLTNRGTKVKNSTDGETYPDGSIADYYGINKWCKSYGFPGIIVEHAFITNGSDAANHLMNDGQLQQLGIADATGIANYFGLHKDAITGIYATEQADGIHAGAVKQNGVSISKYRWMVYDTKKGTWSVISNWSSSEWVTWKPSPGNYWLRVEGVTSDGINADYTMAYNVSKNYVTSYSVKINGIYCSEDKNGIRAGAVHETNDPNTKYRWLVYDLNRKNWKVISNWNSSEWVTWRPEPGNYWLRVEAKTSTGAQSDCTIAYNVSKNYTASYVRINGIYCSEDKTGVHAGAVHETNDSNTKYRWMVYDLKRQTWRVIANWNSSEWVTWKPEPGNYWLRVEAKTSSGAQSDNTVAYNVSKDYTAIALYGINTKNRSDGVGASLNYQSYASKTEFRWMSYNTQNGQWLILSDWSNKSSIDWKPQKGTYWLSVDVRTAEGAYKNSTITYTSAYDYTHPYMEMKGIYCSESKDGYSVGLVHQTNDKSAKYRWLYYNVDKNSWYVLNNWNSSEWATWKPDAGNYWLRAEAKTSDGREYNYTIAYTVEKYSIMGSTQTSLSQMVNYYKANATYPAFYASTDAPTIDRFCQIYLEEAAAEGVKAEVAFCQSMKETGFLRYEGDVSISQFNFAGLGATGDHAHGASFKNVRTGIRAQIQHLKAYASKDKLNNPCVDSRFEYVKPRESAIYVEWLGQHENPQGKGWATAKEYGYSIRRDYINKLKQF